MENTSDFSSYYTDKKLIAFDLYWTCLERLKQAKFKISKEIYINLQTSHHSIKDIQKLLNISDDKFKEIQSQIEEDIANTKLYDDVKETFIYLKSKWYKIAAVSNLSSFYEKPINDLFSEWDFDYKILSFNEWTLKPNLDFFQKIQKKTWFKNNEIILIWDNLKLDIKWAINAWIDAIHIDRNSENIWQIIDKKIFIKISTLKDLIKLL